ncbi:OmpA family protein [Sulfurimonas sp. HSL-3221]|uniref:OmpA family protein n=1 Tax=Sulfurimonadaceae TaxID=2771471 RepID=UPI001E38C1CF|nr:OmpA family protein [Sulfurimonas sp. HSL-3221]UFS62119.1 OmpA family protein [Sulfurimonas sp. HSL-3221]
MAKIMSTIGLFFTLFAGAVLCAESEGVRDIVPDAPKKVEIGLMGVALFQEGKNDPLEDLFPGVGVRAAYRFYGRWSAVAELSAAFDAAYDLPGHGHVNVTDYMAGIDYDLFPESGAVKPYLSLAVGYRTISGVTGRDQWQVLPGLGCKFPLNDAWQLVVEAKKRFNLDENETGWLGMIGVSYLFGAGDTQSAAHAVEAAPEPETVEPDAVPVAAAAERPQETDSDDDGVLDSEDHCLGTKGGVRVDAKGCPVTMAQVVHFPYDSAEVSAARKTQIHVLVRFLNENPAYKVILRGYTDGSGTPAYNQRLSARRSEAVKTLLVKAGIDQKRIVALGRGMRDPVADNASEEGRAKNRRVEAECVVE